MVVKEPWQRMNKNGQHLHSTVALKHRTPAQDRRGRSPFLIKPTPSREVGQEEGTQAPPASSFPAVKCGQSDSAPRTVLRTEVRLQGGVQSVSTLPHSEQGWGVLPHDPLLPIVPLKLLPELSPALSES